jgi:hypothetical protein
VHGPSAHHRSSLPHPAPLRARPSPCRGGQIHSYSRRAPASDFCRSQCQTANAVGWVERRETHQLSRKPRWVSRRSTHPTKARYRQIKEAERRQTHFQMSAPAGAVRATKSRLAPTLRCGRARLSAFHHGSRQGESSSPRLSFGPGFVGAAPNAAACRQRRPHFQRSTSHTGHSAGRHDAQSRPGAGHNAARGHRTRSAFRSISRRRPL